MKKQKAGLLCILIIVFLVGLAGCGGTESNNISNGDESSALEQSTIEQPATAEQVANKVAENASVDDLIGSWTDIISPDRLVYITRTDTGYQYEDNEGKLNATFKDGILKVSITDTDTADVYLDEATGHLICVYQDNISEYKKK